ncbi:caspase family protein [Streptomyces broussonetiae]|uniref:Caspase family protein n=1 Tax=Streptomyces broussonetiae TaxID=2686304 RepID=A0ABV5ED04_9ACTN
MGGTRDALIIANDSYENAGLKRLKAPAHDAVALAGVLGAPGIGGFHVDVMRNEPAHVISLRIDDFFADRRPADTLVLHFSCHGLKSESGELYFAARNTLPRRLASTAVAADFVRRRMTTTRARSVVLFLDCCYGGAFSQGPASVRAAEDAHVLDSFAGEKLGGGRGWAVITASNSMEYAFEGSDLAEGSAPRPRPSLFTHAVVQGLATGEADLDEDGRVSLDELYEYVFDHVRRQNPHQTPSRTVDMQGDMYLAHSHRRRITPAPVPDDLRAAMRSPDLYTRRGAIAELRARMENADLPIAMGAREALAEMVRKDIRFIADEAQRALGEIAINPHPVRVDFGTVPRGAPEPHRAVRLLGPPLARSCAPHPKDDWLRAAQTDDGLDVSVTTAKAGRLSGDLVLKGVVGEAMVHVEAEVVPAERTAPPEPEKGPSPQGDGHADATRPAEPAPPTRPPEHGPPPGPQGDEGAPRVDEGVTRPLGEVPPSPPDEGATRPLSNVPPPRPTRPPGDVPPPPRQGGRVTPPRKETAPPPPRRPPSPARRVPAGARRAPVLAAVALALAVTALFTGVMAAVAATKVGEALARDGGIERIRAHASENGLLAPLLVALAAAVAAIVFRALARHELGARPGRYPEPAEHATRALTWTANLIAVPVAIIALLLALAYFVTLGVA